MPRLVLLPGLDGTGELFAPLVEARAVRTQVMAYPARPGMGYRELVEYVKPRLPAGPFFLLGESFSGPIAIALAAEVDRVQGLILCCTFARRPWPLPAATAQLARLAPRRVGLRWALGRFAAEPLLECLTNAVSGLPSATMERRLEEILQVDYTGKLESLTIPVLSIHASHDRLIRRRLPNSIEVEGPHFLLQHAPGRVAGMIEAWIGGVGAGLY